MEEAWMKDATAAREEICGATRAPSAAPGPGGDGRRRRRFNGGRRVAERRVASPGEPGRAGRRHRQDVVPVFWLLESLAAQAGAPPGIRGTAQGLLLELYESLSSRSETRLEGLAVEAVAKGPGPYVPESDRPDATEAAPGREEA